MILKVYDREDNKWVYLDGVNQIQHPYLKPLYMFWNKGEGAVFSGDADYLSDGGHTATYKIDYIVGGVRERLDRNEKAEGKRPCRVNNVAFDREGHQYLLVYWDDCYILNDRGETVQRI